MSVPESQRQEGKFNVLIDANILSTYTIQICGNQKIFVEQYRHPLTDDIVETAKNIFIQCYEANEINVKSEMQADQRLMLQLDAEMNCNRLLALMQMAKKVFHLDSKRIRYWGNLTINVRVLIQKWHDSDYKRYKH